MSQMLLSYLRIDTLLPSAPIGTAPLQGGFSNRTNVEEL